MTQQTLHTATKLYGTLSDMHVECLIDDGKISKATAKELASLVEYFDNLKAMGCYLHPGSFSHKTFNMMLMVAKLFLLDSQKGSATSGRARLLENAIDIIHLEREMKALKAKIKTRKAL